MRQNATPFGRRALEERAYLSERAKLAVSREYRLISQGISDQHCMTPDYIVDDILAETKRPSIDSAAL